MPVHILVLAVIGHKHSGKTTIVEGLVSELVKKGFKVATAKHVLQKGFTMDTKGKDTWRHSVVGANPVTMVSDTEIVTKIRDGVKTVSLATLSKTAEENGANVVVLEGFSFIVLKDKRVAKVVCVRNQDEYDEYVKTIKGEVLAYCSVHPINKNVLDTRKGLPVIVEKAVVFIEKSQKILEILNQLAGLDCHKCGKAMCWELAEAICNGEAGLEKCVPMKAKQELKTTLKVGEIEVPLQPFVADIIQKTVLGMVSTLKGISIKGNEQIHINIT